MKLKDDCPLCQDWMTQTWRSQKKEGESLYSTCDFSSLWARELGVLLPSSGLRCHRRRLTFLVFLHIEASQEHDSLLAADSTVCRIGRVNSMTADVSPDPLQRWGRPNSEWMLRTPPVPPKRSLLHPKYTARILYCRRHAAHMIHGSTVTYKSVSWNTVAGWLFRISAIPWNSACLVPFYRINITV